MTRGQFLSAVLVVIILAIVSILYMKRENIVNPEPLFTRKVNVLKALENDVNLIYDYYSSFDLNITKDDSINATNVAQDLANQISDLKSQYPRYYDNNLPIENSLRRFSNDFVEMQYGEIFLEALYDIRKSLHFLNMLELDQNLKVEINTNMLAEFMKPILAKIPKSYIQPHSDTVYEQAAMKSAMQKASVYHSMRDTDMFDKIEDSTNAGSEKETLERARTTLTTGPDFGNVIQLESQERQDIDLSCGKVEAPIGESY